MDRISTVDDYIKQFNEETSARLEKLRRLTMDIAPDAIESISYGLIGYKLNGKPLVYYGGFPHHIGLYATPNGHEAFAKEFAKYKQGKGSVQLPLSEPLPLDLVTRVVEYRKAHLQD